jgi:hypothetical protein
MGGIEVPLQVGDVFVKVEIKDAVVTRLAGTVTTPSCEQEKGDPFLDPLFLASMKELGSAALLSGSRNATEGKL